MLSEVITEQSLWFPETTSVYLHECNLRKAVRVVVFDDKWEIAMIRINKIGCFMIPGWGIEKDETVYDAVSREMLEEVWVEVHELWYLGDTMERKTRNNTINHSYVFTAKVKKNLGYVNLEKDEEENGHELIWMKLEDAHKRVMHDYAIATEFITKASSKREMLILEYVRDVASKK